MPLFSGNARDKVHWIAAIGPHWQYGQKVDDGGDVQKLINWHNTIHDLVSWNDLEAPIQLIAADHI